MTSIFLLLRQFWYVIPMALLFAYGTYWHHAAKDIAKDFAVYKADVEKEVAKSKADALAEQVARDKITLEQEKEHAKNDAALNARYADALARLRNVPKTTGSPAGLPPVPDTTRICADPGENNRLLTALLGYRQAVLGLLQQAERQTQQLTEAQAWLNAQQAVKHAPN